MESALRAQVDMKNEEIKKLITNLDRLKKSDKLYEKDWAVLDSIMKPYHDNSAMVERLSELRK